MKILFLHLSDAHFEGETRSNDINIEAMVKSLKQIEAFEECIIIFSGDIAKTGKNREFKRAGGFIGKLAGDISKSYLDGKRIETLIVPGNHDNNVTKKERTNQDLKEFYNSKTQELECVNDLKQLEEFYIFSKKNGCFKKEKFIDVKKVQFGKFIIKANLINSAPFSLLCDGNDDKGLHYLPVNAFHKFDVDAQEVYTITVMHHGPEWFSDKSKKALYNRINDTTDLFFVGHEHFSLSESKIVNGKQIDISSGLALNGTREEQGFNAVILDVENSKLKSYKYIYDKNIYKPIVNINEKSVRFHGKFKFDFTDKFDNMLCHDIDEREGDKYLEYFVFPSLESKNINEDMKNLVVNNYEKCLEVLHLKKRIYVEGGTKSGKTTLSKYLCKVLSKDFVPLYLTVESFLSKDDDKVLKYAFLNQYGDDADYDRYLQLDKNQKIIIIDNSHKVDQTRWNIFFEYICKQVEYIIAFTDIQWKLNIKEKALEELSENKAFYLNICPFYFVKRAELIDNICRAKKDIPIMNIDEKVAKINDDITNQIKYFQLTPDFIHQFVDYYLNFSYIKTSKESNVFSKVFEANITFRIAKNTDADSVDEILVALDFVAHYVHSNKKYPLSYEEFEMAIDNYNSKYDNELKAKVVHDIAIKANVLRLIKEGFGIEFCDENLLAYFTAIHINRSYNEGEGEDELKEILNNICFGINGDVILFMSYITSNIKILTPILTSLNEHMMEWTEMNLDENNIEYLSQLSSPVAMTLPDKKDKKRIAEQKDSIEKDTMNKRKKESESLYVYDETKINSFGNKISKSIRYLELVAKMLPSFKHILKKEQKQSIINILYEFPNKLLYFMLKDIDDNFKEIVSEILDENIKTKKGKLITEDIITTELKNQSIVYILSIYDFISGTASTGKTIKDLNKFDYDKNTTYKLQNMLMEENVGNFASFTKKAEKLYDEADLNITKQMIYLIVRKYFLVHEIKITGDVMHVVDKFFGQSERKKITVMQAKNKLTKK